VLTVLAQSLWYGLFAAWFPNSRDRLSCWVRQSCYDCEETEAARHTVQDLQKYSVYSGVNWGHWCLVCYHYCYFYFLSPPTQSCRTTQVSRYQKGKNQSGLKQETVSGSGISWAICKSAPRSRQITMPAHHHSVFLQAGRPSCRLTNSVKALKAEKN